MRKLSLVAILFVSACSAAPDPSATELATESTTSPVGDWLDHASWNGTGDLVSLQILADGRFARVRCLDDGCGRSVPEDGHWTVQKKTLRFYLGAGNQAGPFTPDPKTLLDSWTFTASRTRLSLSRRGVSLALWSTTDAKLCALSGGAWSKAAASCDCGDGYIFVAGEAGCVPAPVPSEELCDATKGGWSDDDNILLGTYCECPRNHAWVDGTGCAAQ